MAGTLYLVGTPIGNLGDTTDRAREVLGAVDLVAAEDTRRTGRLLAHFGIKARIVSFFEGNERERGEALLSELESGKDVAVVSDAGMPGISDPGFRLVRACIEEGIDVRVAPGPSAALSALVISGLPTDRFVFEGFLPRRAGERRARLAALAQDPRTVIVFESPKRIEPLLREALEAFGDRRMALARELTKLHEEVVRGRISEVLDGLGGRELKGEAVVVFGGAGEPTTPDLGEMVAEAAQLVADGLRKRLAAGEVARRYGVSANLIYRGLVEPASGLADED